MKWNYWYWIAFSFWLGSLYFIFTDNLPVWALFFTTAIACYLFGRKRERKE